MLDDDMSVCPNLYKPNLEKCGNIVNISPGRTLSFRNEKHQEKDKESENLKQKNMWTSMYTGALYLLSF